MPCFHYNQTQWRALCPARLQGIFKSTRVSARLSGSSFEIECRCCSYCGSCFSGGLEGNHARKSAGGWKEITRTRSREGLNGYVTVARLPADMYGNDSMPIITELFTITRS
jgi:hypothetical protein